MNILRMNSLVALETKIVESKILVWWEMICFQIHLHNELKTPVNNSKGTLVLFNFILVFLENQHIVKILFLASINRSIVSNK